MKLKVLASGSSGNCYLLENNDEILILETGITFKKIQQGIDFNINKVVGCLITHEHKDHSKSIEHLCKNGITVYTSSGTITKTGLTTGHRLKAIKSLKRFEVGSFTVLPFDTEHDAEEPLGFLIQHKDMGKTLFITDSYYCKYKFKGLDHILVECNYLKEILDENIVRGVIPQSLRNRITKSHFELENVKEFLKSSDLSKTNEIVLVHLSSQNSNGDLFKSEIEKTTGRPVYIAKQGLELNFSSDIF